MGVIALVTPCVRLRNRACWEDVLQVCRDILGLSCEALPDGYIIDGHTFDEGQRSAAVQFVNERLRQKARSKSTG